MELFNLYTSVSNSWGYMNFMRLHLNDYPYPVLDWKVLVISLCVAVTIWLVLFILQGIGIYRQAKAQGVKYRWLSFVPFANLILIGKLAGNCSFFGQRMRHPGVFVMVAQILCFILGAGLAFSQLYLYAVVGAPQVAANGEMGWTGLTGFSVAAFHIYQIAYHLLPIFQLVCEVLLFILFLGYFKKYKPKHAYLFAILVLFVPFARFILVFIFRNAPAIDFEAYQRQQREEFERRYRAYGNPYGSPYGTSRPPYSQPNSQGAESQQQEPKDEPFAEFGEGNKQSGSTQDGQSGDDWFA